MSTGSDLRRNNVRAGFFTLASLVLFFATLVVLNGDWLRAILGNYNRYTVKFDLLDGVGGLNIGSEVRVGGLVRGSVTEINLVGLSEVQSGTSGSETTSPSSGTAAGSITPSAMVKFQVDEDIELWSNSVAIRTASILGGGSWINISTVGGPNQTTPAPTIMNGTRASLLAADGSATFPATPGDGLLTTMVGSQNSVTTRQILQNVSSMTGFLDQQIEPMFTNDIEPAMADARAIMSDVRNDYGDWSGKIDNSLDSVEAAAAGLDESMQSANATVEEVRADVRLISELVKRNTGLIDDAIANLKIMTEDGVAITHRFKDETLSKVDDALDAGMIAITDMSQILRTIDFEVAASLPSVRSFLQDVLVASGEMKLATIEIRRSPWRILYKPSPGELGNENLFAAARDFTIAASEVRVAAQSFQSVMEQFPKSLEQDPELQAAVERFLAESLKRLENAQSRLFSVIIGDSEDDS
jgi:ABC-type transporter Mla subunit MlaD